MPDWGRFYCQARRFDAGILTDFKSNQRSPGGKRCPETAFCHFSNKAYTYFPVFNQFLRNQKLRFGVVLNHEKMQFEFWLMGQNADVQRAYWELLKDSVWNSGRKEMPKYSILEAVLEDQMDFRDKETMTQTIISRSVSLALEIQEYLSGIGC